MSTYKVKAHVCMIAEAELTVEASSREEAMQNAKHQFTTDRIRRRNCVVPNSVDESYPFDFEPLEATLVESQPAQPEGAT